MCHFCTTCIIGWNCNKNNDHFKILPTFSHWLNKQPHPRLTSSHCCSVALVGFINKQKYIYIVLKSYIANVYTSGRPIYLFFRYFFISFLQGVADILGQSILRTNAAITFKCILYNIYKIIFVKITFLKMD